MPDPTDLTALSGEQLLDRFLQTLSARQFEDLRAELLRRLRQWDALAMGPVDPPAAAPGVTP